MAKETSAADYDTDFFEWTRHQAAALVAGKASELDWANLAEEIESLGKRDRRGLRNRLEILVMHLLKWCYQPERRQTGHSWSSTIWEQRGRIEQIVADSPSLGRLVPDMIAQDYQRVLQRTSDETDLPLETFPKSCPWTVEQVLDVTFWPEQA
jgi:hypothetical protein